MSWLSQINFVFPSIFCHLASYSLVMNLEVLLCLFQTVWKYESFSATAFSFSWNPVSSGIWFLLWAPNVFQLPWSAFLIWEKL